MTLGIMQPYTFPYIGYYQLIASVDRFVIYDDVTFIKQGWINSNQILGNGIAAPFSVPLADQSSFRLIRETQIHQPLYERWKKKFFKTLNQTYRSAPQFEFTFPLICKVFESENNLIANLAVNSLQVVCDYVGVTTQFVSSSSMYKNSDLKGQERILDICRREGASRYINAKGGQALYDRAEFAKNGITLNFIDSLPIQYDQQRAEFIPFLSIIDVLMFNSPEAVRDLINQYELI